MDRFRQVVQSLKDIPAPDASALAHSARLAERIRHEISEADGRISFARFMELALYAPGLGYYVAGARKFGAQGDFVTAPEISPLFARCLARQCQQVFHALGGNGDILEFGAGSGALAADLLRELERLDCLPQRYFILEVSGELRQRQQQTLAQRAPHLVPQVIWLDALPAHLIGVILANEVLDAMPVHRFRIEEHGISDLGVAWDGEFAWRTGTPSEDLAGWYADQQENLTLPPGYESEVNLALGAWIASLADILDAGVALLIDYGFPRHEYYHPQRHGGTLMCHYRHRAHTDPLLLPGLQDITAHVDFTTVAEAAVASGLDVLGYATQAHFLLALGITEFAAQAQDDVRRQTEVAQQVRLLTLPSEMGELFKVIALGKTLDMALQGFALHDQRHRL